MPFMDKGGAKDASWCEGVGDRVAGDELDLDDADGPVSVDGPGDVTPVRSADCLDDCTRACAGCNANTTPCLPSIPGPTPTERFTGRPSYGFGRRFFGSISMSRRLVGARPVWSGPLVGCGSSE